MEKNEDASGAIQIVYIIYAVQWSCRGLNFHRLERMKQNKNTAKFDSCIMYNDSIIYFVRLGRN